MIGKYPKDSLGYALEKLANQLEAFKKDVIKDISPLLLWPITQIKKLIMRNKKEE